MSEIFIDDIVCSVISETPEWATDKWKGRNAGQRQGRGCREKLPLPDHPLLARGLLGYFTHIAHQKLQDVLSTLELLMVSNLCSIKDTDLSLWI